MEHYYMTFCNDGVELFENKCRTKAEAIKELKEAYRADFEEAGYKDPDFEYYIEEFLTSETEICCIKTEYYKLRMGKRGGVSCTKIPGQYAF